MNAEPRTGPSTATVVVSVVEASQVGEARRAAAALAVQLELNETRAGELAIIVTELANNLVRHGGGGEVHLRALATSGGAGGGQGETAPAGSGVEVLALDRGAGIANVNSAMRDGYTTGRTPGTGLGAAARLAGTFDIASTSGRGTAIVARVWPGEVPHAATDVGATCVPMQGETVCGDAWCVVDRGGGHTMILVADGLGHGPAAAEASQLAVMVFRAHADRTPQQIMQQLHAALRPTRGASVAIAEVDAANSRLRFCSVGNIATSVTTREGVSRSLLSHNGTVGAEARRIVELEQPWARGSTLILASDGITTRWSLNEFPGLALRHPSVVAGVLYRDHLRGRDDATVLVLRDSMAP